MRKQNIESHNMRTFEVPGCGSFLLTERTKEQAEFFVEGKEIECFGDLSELVKKIEYFLEKPEQRLAVAKRGREKVLKVHTCNHRIKRLFEILENR